MLRRVTQKPLCTSCSKQLLDLFTGGLVSPSSNALRKTQVARRLSPTRRFLHNGRTLRQNDPKPESELAEAEGSESTPVKDNVAADNDSFLEVRAMVARQIYGDSLPEDYLTPEEYKVYERLFGAPVAFTSAEHEQLEPSPDEIENGSEEHLQEQHALFEENEEGNLEEIQYGDGALPSHAQVNIDDYLTQQEGETAEQFQARKELYEAVASAQGDFGSLDEQTAMLQDLNYSQEQAQWERDRKEMDILERREASRIEEKAQELGGQEDGDAEPSASRRLHLLTEAGRFAAKPSTISIPALEFSKPVQEYLAANARYDHLKESATKIFGGSRLPDSNATPSQRDHVKQKPIPLSASQHHMSRIEANLFMATIMPGAYASAKATMLEVRRRLGGEWLEKLMARAGGPRILDAGAGGAGVLAWREMLQTQWDLKHEDTVSQSSAPLGSSTVLVGSTELQAAVNGLLEETTFIPRLPDFSRQRDLPANRSADEPTRKQYDVIIAPYTIYGIEDDYVRKAQVQNLWSLLDPEGGVLILIEKGVPRGFEAIAEARKVLLQHHIQNPDVGKQEQMEPLIGNFHTHLEDGMIIAPCTNHNQCPMYRFSGEAVGRKDFCRFHHRFERPPFLQRITGAKFHNHEDIDFSYLAVQRGRDQRKAQGFVQNEQSTVRALKGYEDEEEHVHMQTLPRIVKPPIKRTGHVTMDVCTPHGTLERWITTKSFSKQSYRDGRKSKWGDLWALGAKTRVDTPARAGRPRDERKQTIVDPVTGEVVDSTQEGTEQARRVEKAKRREAKMRKPKTARQPKYANDTRKRLTATDEGLDEI